MKTALKALAQHLRTRRANIVTKKDVLVENWSPTYGYGDPSTDQIEIVDFDALLAEIDAFSETFKEGT